VRQRRWPLAPRHSDDDFYNTDDDDFDSLNDDEGVSYDDKNMANSPDPADDDDMVGMSLKIHQTSITRQDS
jgi:hypothetical protein